MSDVEALVGELRRTVRTLAGQFDLDAELAHLCSVACHLLPVDAAAVTLLDDDGGGPQPAAVSGEVAHRIAALQQRLGEGPGPSAIEHDRPVVAEDLTDHTQRWPGFAAVALLAGMRAVLALPLRDGAAPVGSLDLFRREPLTDAAPVLEVGEALAEGASAFVTTHRHRQRTEEVTEQLQRALRHRVVVEQAKGMLAARQGISPDEAFERLRRHARDRNHRIAEVARAVVAGDLRLEGTRPDGH